MSVLGDITYHVQIHKHTQHVNVSSIGIDRVDSDVLHHYNSVDELPEWIQTKLSMLMMLDLPPPLNDVDGVGSRLGQYTYWVYK